jgi:hypothetical protein
MAIGVALARTIDHLEEGRWVTGDTIGYVRTSGEHGVDLGPVTVLSADGPVATFPLEPSGSRQAEKAQSGCAGRCCPAGTAHACSRPPSSPRPARWPMARP